MKKFLKTLIIILIFVIIFMLCFSLKVGETEIENIKIEENIENKEDIYIVNTYDITPLEKIEESFDNDEFVITKKYYKLSDGTYKLELINAETMKTEEYIYKYKLEISGRLHNAKKDSAYIVLSNRENVTFDECWKASGLSSNSNDYFKLGDTVIVGRK